MNKIKVGILGATGSVGQKFIELLTEHPWFEISELAASEKSAGKKYYQAANWILSSPLDDAVAGLTVKECNTDLESKILFSALDSSAAGEIETELADSGKIVISNARNHRFDENVPLIIPEVNPDHLQLLGIRNLGSGGIVTNPNCSTIGLVTALKPIRDKFGIESVNVVTMQAISGAGYPGLSSLDIIGNVIPFISGEEEKLEKEPLKILGTFAGGKIEYENIKINAQCNRVQVIDGHTETVQITLKEKAAESEIIECWNNFTGLPQRLNLPSAPEKPIIYFRNDSYPQPKKHSLLGGGMTVSTGRLRPDKFFDYKFVALSHNTIRGAAGNTILIAELMKAQNLI